MPSLWFHFLPWRILSMINRKMQAKCLHRAWDTKWELLFFTRTKKNPPQMWHQRTGFLRNWTTEPQAVSPSESPGEQPGLKFELNLEVRNEVCMCRCVPPRFLCSLVTTTMMMLKRVCFLYLVRHSLWTGKGEVPNPLQNSEKDHFHGLWWLSFVLANHRLQSV